jgi:hypothetical protein
MSGFAYIRRFGRLDEQPDDGWVDGFSTSGHHLWRAPFEPGRGIPQRRRDGTTGIAIGGLGNVYAVGWASVPGTPERRSGTMVLQKLTRTGRLLWRRSMLRLSSSVIAFHVAVRANRMMVAGQYGGGYGLWLGGFTVGGAFVSKRTWGSVRYKRFASDVAIDSQMRTWVVGGYGYDNGFARRYSAQGRIDWTKIVRGPKYFMFMTGVDTLGHGVAISGSGSDQVEPYRGYVWRFA